MSITELSQRIEEKVAERAGYARTVRGAPPHIAEAVEPRLVEVNKEIRELQAQMHVHATPSA